MHTPYSYSGLLREFWDQTPVLGPEKPVLYQRGHLPACFLLGSSCCGSRCSGPPTEARAVDTSNTSTLPYVLHVLSMQCTCLPSRHWPQEGRVHLCSAWSQVTLVIDIHQTRQLHWPCADEREPKVWKEPSPPETSVQRGAGL